MLLTRGVWQVGCPGEVCARMLNVTCRCEEDGCPGCVRGQNLSEPNQTWEGGLYYDAGVYLECAPPPVIREMIGERPR